MEEGKSDNNLRLSFDCADIIEQVISSNTVKQDRSIKVITDSVKKQREDLSKMVETIDGLTSALTTINRGREFHTSKKIHNAKKKLILIVLKLWIVLLLILGYKLKKQCILIGKNLKSTNKLNT